MHCPSCLVEYREGFTECSDCHVSLAPGPPPGTAEPSDAPLRDIKLVTVLETSDPLLLGVAKDLLAAADIPFIVFGEESMSGARAGYGYTPLTHPPCFVQVPRDRESAALEVLQDLPQPIDTETLPIDTEPQS